MFDQRFAHIHRAAGTCSLVFGSFACLSPPVHSITIMPKPEDPLVDMNGPQVPWTVADLLRQQSNELQMTYHVLSTPWDVFTPVGGLLGAALYGTRLWRPYPTLAATMGTTSLFLGGVGMAVGYAGLKGTMAKGETATPPWTPDGIQNRVDGLHHNFKVRVLDKSAWSGMGVAAGVVLLAGGPVKLGLSPGLLGTMQALCLGSSLGSLSAFGCIYATLPKKDDDDDE